MVIRTATIRVSRPTHDLLASQARDRGLSIAALLAEIAREREASAIWESERVAVGLDSRNRQVSSEEQVWDEAIADGVE